ncbi:MAG: ParB/RepB/Spo0J family partition protein [Myxococcota bacterium]|nr:ParB/RepB/Spo0J family partition protein [Myxococcota bacterium]
MSDSNPTSNPLARGLKRPTETTAGPSLVPLDRIDRADTQFQLRVTTEPDALMSTIAADGQQSPVVLWQAGEAGPYKIVDGFHRIEAIAKLGGREVLAVIRRDIDRTGALTLSFLLNAHRRNLKPLDKANAVARALTYFGMSKPAVATALGLSVRQVNRYLAALRFEAPLQRAIEDGRITLQHAAILHRHRVAEPEDWIRTIERESLSSRELGRRLRADGVPRPRRSPLVRDELGFRLAAIRYRHNMGTAEKNRIRAALEAALAAMR